MKYSTFVISLALLVTISSCKKEKDDLEESNYIATPYKINVPSNLPILETPAENPTTVEGVILGRMLYYDNILHPQSQYSCSSCHHQSEGFTTAGTNIIPHINLAFSKKFLWNGRLQGSLEEAMKFEVEEFFGTTNTSKLQADPIYPILFKKAFGSSQVTLKNTEFAMAQFVRTMISGNSKFDRFVRHEENLTTQEMIGFTVFNTEKGDCFHCHSISMMTDNELHNIGLDSIFDGVNQGYFASSGNPADLGKFKSPSLRNVALRTSYMHDGRFTTLDQVINHYNNEVKLSPSLDPIMTKPGKEFGLGLTSFEIEALKAFLNTLTDSTYLNNPNLSSPF